MRKFIKNKETVFFSFFVKLFIFSASTFCIFSLNFGIGVDIIS